MVELVDGMGGSGAGVLVVRRARAADAGRRLQLLCDAMADSFWEAFLYFFFQELTLQCVVLTGAVLFIFGGAGPGALALLPPAAAALAAAAVRLHATSVAAQLPAKLRNEEWGFVVEACGVRPGAGGTLPVLTEEQYHEQGYGPTYKQVVGTVSVTEARGAGAGAAGWWVWGLATARGWARRGAGSALLAAVARAGAGAGGAGGDMHAVVSHLQPAARALMHKLGWECRGTYHRPLLGDALVLPMAHLVLSLPHA